MSERRRAAAALLFLLPLLMAVPSVAAEEVTAAELEQLVRDAGEDPAARRRLGEVTAVDGRAVDIGRALADASPEELQARLDALEAEGSDAPSPAPDAVRGAAEEILGDPRFRADDTPRPLQGVLRRLGGWLAPVLRPLDRVLDALLASVLGRVMFGAVVITAAVAVSALLIRRRSRAGVRRERRDGPERGSWDPDALERAAEEAERAGDLAGALRLRFRAGLLRLDAAGRISYRPSATTRQVARALRSPTFDELAGSFEQVVYGGRPATSADLREARDAWPRVLAEVGR